MNSWEGFSASCCLWNFFCWKTIVEMLEDVVFSWREVRWLSYSHTQISQSLTSSQCRNPYFSPHSLCMKVSSPFRQLCPPLWFLVVNFPLYCKPPTKSRTWEKVLDLSETLLWLHLLCLPSTAGPNCPGSQKNTVHRWNPAPSEQWWRLQGLLWASTWALARADCTRKSSPCSGISLAQKAQSTGNLELKISSSLRTWKKNKDV